MAHKFGGPWTEKKIEIFIKYLNAYLQIMKNKPFKLIYFDGFAGSGKIEKKSQYKSLIEGVASKVLSISEPRTFDIYYLVELDRKKGKELERILKKKNPEKSKNVFVQISDCNEKLISLAGYLKSNKLNRALAFIDPHGMEVNWNSIIVFKDLGIDMWVLVPTGVAVNRMLKRNAQIPESWIIKLENFLGLKKREIMKSFYHEDPQESLFSNETKLVKEQKITEKIIDIYSEKLLKVWRYVSKPLPLKNSKGNCIYHFLLLSNNKTAISIANDIIIKELKK